MSLTISYNSSSDTDGGSCFVDKLRYMLQVLVLVLAKVKKLGNIPRDTLATCIWRRIR